MTGEIPLQEVAADGAVLHWTGRLLSAEDLRRTLNGQRELILPARTVLTPSAAEHIQAHGLRVSRRAVEEQPAATVCWGYAQQRPHAHVQTAVRALEREGVGLRELQVQERASACSWCRAVAECIARGDCQGGVVFCDDAGLLCCVANKVAGLRAAAANTVDQAARASLMLGANLLAVEMPGRTFFEVRQILRMCCSTTAPACPAAVAAILKELDGHAHR